MKHLPIRVRLTLWFLLMLVVTLTVLSAFVLVRLRDDLTTEVDRALAVSSTEIVQGFREGGVNEFELATREMIATPGARTLGAQVVDAEGEVLRAAGDAALRAPLVDGRFLAGVVGGAARSGSTHADASGRHLRVVAVSVVGGGEAAAIVVAEPLDGVDRALRRVRLLLLGGGLAALAFAGAGGWWIASRALEPVSQMIARADSIDASLLDQRIPVPPAHDELRRLAGTLNEMLRRLEDGVAARERLVADASHELRAPLAAMRADLDVSLRVDDLGPDARRVLESLRVEVARMGRVVDNLLTLARIDEGRLALVWSDEDAVELADRVARAYAAAARAADVALEVVGETAPLRCDRDRIEQVVGNLVDNALRFSPRGGKVQVQVLPGDPLEVCVQDEGPGIDDTHRELIFDRFGRVDPSRGRAGGAGLGLAISREIANAHGGSLELRPKHPETAGALFVLTLPQRTSGTSFQIDASSV